MEDVTVRQQILCSFIYESADCAVVLLDLTGQVVFWNEGARRLKGYDAEEVLGTSFTRFYPAEAQAAGHPERELAATASIGRYEEEGWRVRKDNTRFWAHVIIKAIHDKKGNVCGFGKIVQDVTGRKQAEEQAANVLHLLEMTARTDFLTGLDNRRSMDKALRGAVSSARRHGKTMCLAMLDLDKFKEFNDRHGHQAGDAYLKTAADSWRKIIRPEDTLARYGGEEFTIVLSDTDLAGAIACLERVLRATPPPLTCSAGLAEWDGIETPDQLISRADRAVYEAKAKGRDRLILAAEPRPVLLTQG